MPFLYQYNHPSNLIYKHSTRNLCFSGAVWYSFGYIYFDTSIHYNIFYIDKDVKQSAESALNNIGLTLSAAITVFLKKATKEHRIPFELSADPFYSKSNIRYLNKVIDGIENGTRPLTEHDSIAIDAVKGRYDD